MPPAFSFPAISGRIEGIFGHRFPFSRIVPVRARHSSGVACIEGDSKMFKHHSTLLVVLSIIAGAATAQAQDRASSRPSRESRESAAQTIPSAWADQLTWRCIGPANMGGRITAIAV